MAVFVPRQERILIDAGRRTRDEALVSLESYLRGCERADHAAWHDVAGLKVVDKIRSNCGRILRDFGSRRPPTSVVAPSIRMARNLADLVLPERGMGTDGRSGSPSPPRKGGTVTGGGGRGNGGGNARSSPAMPSFEVLEVTYIAHGIQVLWSLEWGSFDLHVPRKISLRVDSEGGPITLRQWRSDGLGVFPFRALDAVIESEGQDDSGVSIEIDYGGEGDILLRCSGIGPIPMFRGMLRVGVAASSAGALRPLLVAGLVEPDSEHA